MNSSAIYSSKSVVKSFWQTYHIFEDRLELHSLFGNIIVPFEKIERAVCEDSDVKGLFKGDLKLNNFRPALKLDWANLTEHIVIDKSDGLIHRILFTPDNPHEFILELEKALEKYKK